MPRVSAIIPTYNHARFVAQAVREEETIYRDASVRKHPYLLSKSFSPLLCRLGLVHTPQIMPYSNKTLTFL
jgi:hypothetical protein